MYWKLAYNTRLVMLLAAIATLCGSLCLVWAGDPSTVLISRGPVMVTRADYEAELLQRIPEGYRFEVQAKAERISQLLDSVYMNKALAREARDLGLDKDPLVRTQMDLAADRVLARARLDRLVADAKLPNFEQLAREEYQAHLDKYRDPEQVHVSHILIRTTTRTDEEANKLAQKVRDLALQSRKSFADLALEYSEDPAVKTNKGDIGAIVRGKTLKPFEDAAFSLKRPGDISQVVRTKYGFHIIRLEERVDSRQLTFDDIKSALMLRLKQNYIAQIKDNHLRKLRSPEGLYVNTDAIAGLKKSLPKDQLKANTSALPYLPW